MKFIRNNYKVLILVIIISIVSFFIKVPFYILPKKIDSIYVINLERSKDRKEYIDKKMKEAGLDYKIFKAVDGSSLKIMDSSGFVFSGKELKNRIKFGETYTIFCPNINITYKYKSLMHDNPMLSGSMGCYCSHLEVLNLIFKNKENLSVILEDDILIDNNFVSGINAIKGSAIDAKYPDIIYLGMIKGKPGIGRKIKTNRPILFSNLNKLTSAMPGLHAYATSYIGAKNLLELLIKTDRQIDNKIYEFIKEKKIKNAYMSSNSNINQISGPDHGSSQIALINNEK